jgi:type II secretory pathway pseudopilin PulG
VPSRPLLRRSRPVALLAVTGLLLSAGGVLAYSAATSVQSTEGALSTKAQTTTALEAQQGAVQDAIARSANGSGPGYYASGNVSFVKNIREAADGVGARVVGNMLYVTTTKDLQIYDITEPTNPVRQGLTTVDVEFENEQVPTDGKILGISAQTSSVTTQAAPCLADLEAVRGCLLLFDVRDATAPKLVQSIKGAGDHTSTCITFQGQTCAYMYGSSGSISDIRAVLTDPTPIVESKVNWIASLHGQLREQGWTEALPTRTHHQTEVRPGQLLTASVPQMLISVNAEDGGSPVAPKLLAFASHLAAPDNQKRFTHSVEWPQAGASKIMMSGGETNAEPTCGEDNGAFSTFTVKAGNSNAPVFTYADQYKLQMGSYEDGNTPPGGYKLGCSVHWFQQHPSFKDGGTVALAAYESGTRFLDVAKDGSITEKGFFLPLDSSASATHWAPDGRTLYVIDYLRGIDVITYDAAAARGGKATLQR